MPEKSTPCFGAASRVVAGAGVAVATAPKPHGPTFGSARALTYPSRSPHERNATRRRAFAEASLRALAGDGGAADRGQREGRQPDEQRGARAPSHHLVIRLRGAARHRFSVSR